MLTAVLLTGCHHSTISPSPVPLNEPFVLAVGAGAVVADVMLDVAFEDVVSDSRCPVEAQCVDAVAGSVTTRVSVSMPGHPRELLTLDTGSIPTSRSVYHGFQIALEGIQPAAHPNRTIPPHEYRATLEVTPYP